MDRQLLLGNRVVNNYMQERQKKRLKDRLKSIKQNRSQYSSIGLIKQKPRANSLFFEKNQEIQKQNIALFNRIASIIKKNPKLPVDPQTAMQKSRQTSFVFHRKIQSSLEEENKRTFAFNSVIQKRLSSQKPTINNKLFYQERAKHMRYLKSMSRYPYILNKKVNTEPDVNAFDDVNINNAEFPPLNNIKSEFQKESIKQLFRHQSLDFAILVTMDMKTDVCTFTIQSSQSHPENYMLCIPKAQFIEYFEESEYDYEKMIGNLRLNDDGVVEYIRTEKQSKVSHTPKEEKDFFKFKAQSTAYTSTGFKTGFRSNKRNILSKSQNQIKGNSKTDRKITKYHIDDKIQSRKQSDSLSQNKFAEINLISKDR